MVNQIIGILIATVLTSLTYAMGIHFKWDMTTGWLLYIELIAVWTAYWGTYLCVVQSRTNYPVNAVSVLFFAILFYEQNFIASTALQVYLFPWLVYGFWRWQPDTNTRPVSSLKFDRNLAGYLLLAVSMYGFGLVVNNWLHGTNTVWDTAIFALSIAGQLSLDNKQIFTWILFWLPVDIIAVPLYWSQGLKITAIQFVLFGIQTLWGHYSWYYNRHETNTVTSKLPI